MKSKINKAIKAHEKSLNIDYSWISNELGIANASISNSHNKKHLEFLLRNSDNALDIFVKSNSYSDTYFKQKVREQLKLDKLYSNKIRYNSSLLPGTIIIIQLPSENPERITELGPETPYVSLNDEVIKCSEKYLFERYRVNFLNVEEHFCYSRSGRRGPFSYAYYSVIN